MVQYVNLPSYVLSRISFLFTHVVALYWLNYLLNDPWNVGGATLDARQKYPDFQRDILPAGKCNSLIIENVKWDALLFALWIITHSGFARRKYKQISGLIDHPLERPLFATIAVVVWFINIHFWKPVSNCKRWNPIETSVSFAVVSGIVGTLGLVLILTFLWKMPDHVFGTAKYQFPPGKLPHSKISYEYPYGLVRHPAATGFLWIYTLLPAHTPSHYLVAIYILIGTLVLEEGGLKSSSEFGKDYLAYRSQVNAFIPRPRAIASLLGLKATSRFGYRSKVTEILATAGITVNGSAPHDIKVTDPRFFREFISGGRMALGETYMDGWWDCDDIEAMFRHLFQFQEDVVKHVQTPEVIGMALAGKLLPYGSKKRSTHIGTFHYDLGNELYERFLDPYNQYTCGYYNDGAKTLAQAQEAKLGRIARKLKLKPGHKLLDIGCGWGGLIRYMTKHHGIEATGISISKEQLSYASELCKGLPATFKFQDYRDLNGEEYDRVTTVGMIEHVGKEYYRIFFESVHRAMKKNGVWVLHTIGSNTSDYTNPWLQKYIFPGCFVPSIKHIGEAYEGLFVLEHVENIGYNYRQTLLDWAKAFDENWDAIRAHDPVKYDARFYRMWKYYLLSCASGFAARKIQLWQFVFSKGGMPGGYVFN